VEGQGENLCVCVCVRVRWCVSLICETNDGGNDAQDALKCMSLSAKEPLIVGLFCRK